MGKKNSDENSTQLLEELKITSIVPSTVEVIRFNVKDTVTLCVKSN
jgi:hypothetical protein